MASIDAEYWTKCIEHMKKEVRYYQLHDRVHTDTIDEPVTIDPVVIAEPTAHPMIISVNGYREFSPYANFITANFISAVFQNYY